MDKVIKAPVLWESKEMCCGCSACYAVCPTNAIVMRRDEDGFSYPYINYEKCSGCGTCQKVCLYKREG